MAQSLHAQLIAPTPPLGKRYFWFLAVTMLAYLIRDALTGVWRWSLNLAGLDALWFLPDVMGFFSLLLFAGGIAVDKRSPVAFLVLAMFTSSVVTATFFVSAQPVYLFSSIKMVIPLIAGWALAGRNVLQLSFVRRFVFLILIASIFGLILAPYIEYPWNGFSVDQFGVAKRVGKIWWIQGQVRHGGLGGESTLSAAMVVFPLILLHRYLPRWLVLILGGLAMWATIVATSRTASSVLGLFLIYFVFVAYIAPSMRSIRFHRDIATASFALILVPVFSVGIIQVVNFGELSSSLNSLQERIEISWQYPFSFMLNRWPESLFFGCGVGCFTAPMRYTNFAIFQKPVDNFYVLSLIMYGWSFVIVAGSMLLSTRISVDRTKLILIATLNLYSVTVESYSPSIVTLLIAYATSDVFCETSRRISSSRNGKRVLKRVPRVKAYTSEVPV